MVRCTHWHRDGKGCKYICGDPSCKLDHLSVNPMEHERQMAKPRVDTSRSIVHARHSDSVKIDLQPEGHLQIPAQFIVEVDALFRRMLEMGNLSPELTVWLGPTKEGPNMWQCSFGGYITQSMTPFAALSMMGRIVLRESFESDDG